MKKIFKTILSSVLCLLLVINTFTVFATDADSSYNKIDTLLLKKLEDISDDQKISVWILFQDINKAKLSVDVESECGINPDSFSYKLPQLTNEQIEILQTDILERDDIWKNDFVSLLSDYKDQTLESRNNVIKKMRRYKKTYREISNKMYKENNEKYFKKCNVLNSEIIFQSSLSPFTILSITKEKIFKMTDFSFVKNINYFNDNVENIIEEPNNNNESLNSDTFSETKADYTRTNKAIEKFGVTGEGINVLMLESGLPYEDGSGCIDFSKVKYIHNQNEYTYLKSNTQDVDLTKYKTDHAVLTTKTLQKYASGVNIYSVHRKSNALGDTYNEFPDIEWTIINKDIDILNCSGNYWFYDNYSNDIYSLWFDYLVSNYNILLTAAVGNGVGYCESEWHKVHSIASGYNTIGVGAYNVDEHGNPVLYNFRYSSMDYPNAVQYKPDMVVEEKSSSEASPGLAAIAALALEINPNFLNGPEILKAILMASCHKKAIVTSNNELDDMFSGLTLKQGAGIVDAYQVMCIVLSNSFGIGHINSGYVEYDNISVPSDDYVNFSLVWYINNTYSENSAPNGVVMGNIQELRLDVFENDTLLCTSNKMQAGKQLAYFEYDTNKDYKFRITKTSPNNEMVNFAYAWSPSKSNELSSVEIQGKFAVGQELTAVTKFTEGDLVEPSNLTYRWYKSTDGNTWTLISGANYYNYRITDNENLGYIKCIVRPKNKTSIFATSIISTEADIPVIKYGDANLDGSISMIDVSLIQKYLANLITELSAEQLRAADVDGDGQISVNDVALIQKYIAKYIDVFPVEL